jgi:hypothetical protein
MLPLKAASASLSVVMHADISLVLTTRQQRASAVSKSNPFIVPPMAVNETVKLVGEYRS